MIWYVLLISASVAYLTWLYMRYQSVWKYIARFQGPFALPILGNVLQLGRSPEEYFTSMRRWFKQYNEEPFRLYAGPQPYVFFGNTEHIETILSSSTLLYKDDIYAFVRPWLGQGLLTSNGQYWAKHRKMITPSFHFQILQDFLHIINETSDRFMKLLENFAKSEQMFDMQEIVTRSTLDIICECAMGYRLNSIEGGKSPMVQAINDICYVIQERVFSALKRPNLLFRLTADYQLQEKSLRIMHEEFSQIIETRRKFLDEHSNSNASSDPAYKRPKMAFLDNLLTASIDGQPLTFQEIFEEVSTFMFEGHDTTASALTFATYCLSRHPHVQQKAFEEQLDMFGTDVARWPTYQEQLDMKYLEQVIKETLRLFPSVPVIARTATKLTEIDGYLIPAGTTIGLPLIGLSCDERNFPEPFKFRPERFELDNREQASPFEYVPFSAGPRNCIGQKFAMMEMKCTLSKLLRNFVILPAVDGLSEGIHDPSDSGTTQRSHYDVQLAAPLTLKSGNGVMVRLLNRVYSK